MYTRTCAHTWELFSNYYQNKNTKILPEKNRDMSLDFRAETQKGIRRSEIPFKFNETYLTNSSRLFHCHPTWDLLFHSCWYLSVLIDTDSDLPYFRTVLILDIDAVFSRVFIADFLYGNRDNCPLHIHFVAIFKDDNFLVFEPSDFWVRFSRDTAS